MWKCCCCFSGEVLPYKDTRDGGPCWKCWDRTDETIIVWEERNACEIENNF